MPETNASLLKKESVSELLLKSHCGEKLTKQERQRLRKACLFCLVGELINSETTGGYVCDDCGRPPMACLSY